MRAGIAGVGGYLPAGRLQLSELRRHWPSAGGPPGVRSVAVPDADEDVVTMAVEAVEVALRAAAGPGASAAGAVDALAVATCSSPYAEHSCAAEVARALGLDPAASLADHQGSALGGVQALAAAADAVRAGRHRRVVVVAAERRRGGPGTAVEALGSGAVAVVVTADGPGQLRDFATWRHGVPTRWRPEGSLTLAHYDDARYETNEQVIPAVRNLASRLPIPSFVAIGPMGPRAAAGVSRACGLPGPAGGEVVEAGDLGAAAPLFGLAEAVSGSGAGAEGLCIAVEPGSGAAGVAVALAGPVPVATSRPPARAVDYVGYLQRFGVLSGPVPPDPIVPFTATPGAMRADQSGSLSGGRCQACGGLNVPPRRRCIDCGGTDLVIERAPRRGAVVTFNLQHVVAVHPETAPVAVGVVRLDGATGSRGGQISAMFASDGIDALAVGAEVELVYRRLGVEAGLVKYGWKARVASTRRAAPATDPGHDPGEGEHAGAPAAATRGART